MTIKVETKQAPTEAGLPPEIIITEHSHTPGEKFGDIIGEEIRVGGFEGGKGGFFTPPNGSSIFADPGQSQEVEYTGPISEKPYKFQITGS